MASTPKQHLTHSPNTAGVSTGKNYWVVRDEYPFVTWYATFPDRPVEPRDYLEFLKEVLAAAEREEVLHVVKASLGKSDRKYYPEQYWEYQSQPGRLTYIQYMEQVFAATGKIIAWEQLPSSPNSGRCGPTRLSYYETDGQLVEAEVEDIGALLRRLRPNEIPDDFSEEERYSRENTLDAYKAYGSALYFYGQLGSDSAEWSAHKAWEKLPKEIRNPEREPYVGEAYISIHLYTDIWFPYVTGVLEDMAKPFKYPDNHAFDNRELALRHTPRLNRFLQSVKQLIERRGGHMSMDCSNFQQFHGSMCSDDGIILDV